MHKWLKYLLKIVLAVFLLGSIIFVFIIKTDCFDTDKKIGALLAQKITDETGFDIKFDRIKISLFTKPNIRINRLKIFDKNSKLLSAKDLSINIGSLIRFGTKDLLKDLLRKNLVFKNLTSSEVIISLAHHKITLTNTQLDLFDQYIFKGARFVIPLKAQLNLKIEKFFVSREGSKDKDLRVQKLDLTARFDLIRLIADIKFSSKKIKYHKSDHRDLDLTNFIGNIELQKNRLNIKLIAEENIMDKFIFDANLLIGSSLFDPKLVRIEKFKVNKFMTKTMKNEREIFFRFISKLEIESDK